MSNQSDLARFGILSEFGVATAAKAQIYLRYAGVAEIPDTLQKATFANSVPKKSVADGQPNLCQRSGPNSAQNM